MWRLSKISNIHNCQAKQCYLPFPQAAAETTSPLSWWNGMFCTLVLNTFYWWGLICQHTDASRKGTNHFYPVLNKEIHNSRHKVPFHFRLDELVYRGQMNAVVSASLIGYSAWLETFQREVNDREGKSAEYELISWSCEIRQIAGDGEEGMREDNKASGPRGRHVLIDCCEILYWRVYP